MIGLLLVAAIPFVLAAAPGAAFGDAADAAADDARWPALSSGPLEDNSFLIEEAYNFLLELVATRDAEIAVEDVDYANRVVLNPGLRVGWNGSWGIQWVIGASAPIGLTRATDDLGVFLYFSVENAFTAAALEKRRW